MAAVVIAFLIPVSTAVRGESAAEVDPSIALMPMNPANETLLEIGREAIQIERLPAGRAVLRLLVEPYAASEIALRERGSPFAPGGNWWKIISREGVTLSSGTIDLTSFEADVGSLATFAYVGVTPDFVYGVIDLPEHRINIGPRPTENGLYIEYSPASDGCETRYLTITRLDGASEPWLTLNESIVANFPAVARDLLLQAEQDGSARAPIEPEDSKRFRNVLLREEIAQYVNSSSRWEYRGNYYTYSSPVC